MHAESLFASEDTHERLRTATHGQMGPWSAGSAEPKRDESIEKLSEFEGRVCECTHTHYMHGGPCCRPLRRHGTGHRGLPRDVVG